MFGAEDETPFGESNYEVLNNGMVVTTAEDKKSALLYIEGRTGKSNLTSAPSGWKIRKKKDDPYDIVEEDDKEDPFKLEF